MHRLGEVSEHLKALASELILGFGLLVGVADGAQNDELPLPAWASQFLTQDNRGIELDNDAALEVTPRIVAQVPVAVTGEAIEAGVLAATKRYMAQW
jgi:hypothetical protein